MYHRISIKGLIILKKKSTYIYALRLYVGLSRSPGTVGERSDPEGVKGVRVIMIQICCLSMMAEILYTIICSIRGVSAKFSFVMKICNISNSKARKHGHWIVSKQVLKHCVRELQTNSRHMVFFVKFEYPYIIIIYTAPIFVLTPYLQ